jgi:NAD(P)-dependent dehydrogenase (short-subunit alcohol dehydrogenase family)
VIALDINPEIATMFQQPEVLGLRCDVTVADDISRALESGVRAFGGLDMLVLNAGVFPGGKRVAAAGGRGVATA